MKLSFCLRSFSPCLLISLLWLGIGISSALASSSDQMLNCFRYAFSEKTSAFKFAREYPEPFISYNGHLVQKGSAIDSYPGLLAKLERIGRRTADLKRWLTLQPSLTVGEVMDKAFEAREKDVIALQEIASSLPNSEPLKQVLEKAAKDFAIKTHEKNEKSKKRNNGQAGTVVGTPDLSHANVDNLDTYFSFVRGLRGEILVAASLAHLRGYSMSAAQLHPEVRNVLELKGFSKIEVRDMLEKEIDLVTLTPDGLEHWVEVKNTKEPYTVRKLSNSTIVKQVLRVRQIVADIGLTERVQLEIIFINCIEAEAAALLSNMGVKVLGCVI